MKRIPVDLKSKAFVVTTVPVAYVHPKQFTHKITSCNLIMSDNVKTYEVTGRHVDEVVSNYHQPTAEHRAYVDALNRASQLGLIIKE